MSLASSWHIQKDTLYRRFYLQRSNNYISPQISVSSSAAAEIDTYFSVFTKETLSAMCKMSVSLQNALTTN